MTYLHPINRVLRKWVIGNREGAAFYFIINLDSEDRIKLFSMLTKFVKNLKKKIVRNIIGILCIFNIF